MPSKEKGAGKMDTFMDKFAQRKKAQGMIDANAAADAAKMEKLKNQVSEYELLLQEMRKVNLRTVENAGQMRKAIQTGIEKLEAFQTENEAQAEKDKALSEIRNQMEALLPVIEGQQHMISEEIEKRMESVSEAIKEQKSALSEEIKKQSEENFGEVKKQQEGLFEEVRGQQKELFEEIRKQQEDLSEEVKRQQEVFSGEVKKQREAILEEAGKRQEAFSEEMKKLLEEAFCQTEDFFHKESVKVYRNVQAAMTEELNKQTETLSALQTESGKKQKGLLPLTVVMLLLLLADIAVQLLYIMNIKLF